MKITKRQTVVISCVAFETVKIVKPIAEIGADRVYLLHWTKENGEGDAGKNDKKKGGKKGADKKNKDVYAEFLEEVCRQLRENPGIEPIRVKTEVYKFAPVLKHLVEIMKKERKDGNDVYINLSAGPTTYAAAGMIACMMEGAKPFSIGVKEFMVKEDAFYENGKPVGLAKDVYYASELPTFPLHRPPEDLVAGLKTFQEKKEKNHSTTYRKMIKDFREAGLITKRDKSKDQLQSDKMYYRRHFIDKWLLKGWVEEDGGVLELTDAGNMVCEVF